MAKPRRIGVCTGAFAQSFHRRPHRRMELYHDDFLLAFLDLFEQPLPARPAAYRAAPRRKARLVLEPLEARALLASYSAANVSSLITDITAANTAGGANTITLTAPTTSPYTLKARNNETSTTGANGLPVIAANDNLTIVGDGDTIDRSALQTFRLFDVAPAASLTLQNLTLKGGSANYGTSGGRMVAPSITKVP